MNKQEIMKSMGYIEGRQVNINAIIQKFNGEGFIYNDLQLDFLRKFAFLEISYPHPIWKHPVKLSINPIKSVELMPFDYIEYYEKYFGSSFLVIGEIRDCECTLFIDSNGVLYNTVEPNVIKYGKDFFEMIYEITTSVKKEVIRVEDDGIN